MTPQMSDKSYVVAYGYDQTEAVFQHPIRG